MKQHIDHEPHGLNQDVFLDLAAHLHHTPQLAGWGQVLMYGPDADAALANGGGDAFDGAASDVAGGEYAGHAHCRVKFMASRRGPAGAPRSGRARGPGPWPAPRAARAGQRAGRR
jgi:hypothetical protein